MTTNLEQGTMMEDMSNYYYYQLNLNIHKFKENIGEKVFYFKEETTNELLIENLKVIHKSLDYYSKLYYNKSRKLTKDVIWLALINAKSFREIEEMASLVMEKEEKEKFMKDIKDASKDKFVLSEWETEKMANLVKNESIKYAKQQGKDEMLHQTILAMLEQNIEIDTISKVTGESIKEIQTIKESLK